MSDIGRWVIWGLLPSLLAGLFLNTVVPFESVNSDVFSVVLTDPILRVSALTVVIVAPMYFGVSYIIGLIQSLIDRRRNIKKSNSPSVYSSTSKPSKLTWYGVVRQYGADWYVAFGEPRRGSSKYAYIEKGPCCPNCQTEMVHRNKTRFLALKKRVWLCPECETVVNRPKEVLFEETRGVENIVEKHVTAALSTENPEKYIDSIETLDTGQWGKGLP
jgi:ribosomal protein L37AE/L43A